MEWLLNTVKCGRSIKRRNTGEEGETRGGRNGVDEGGGRGGGGRVKKVALAIQWSNNEENVHKVEYLLCMGKT